MNSQFHVGLSPYHRVQFLLKQGRKKPTTMLKTSDFSAGRLRNVKEAHCI